MLPILTSVASHVVLIAFGLFTGGLFSVAIISLVGSLSTIVFHSIVGEFFALVSLCLPFNPTFVFSSIGLSIATVLGGIVSFAILRFFRNYAKPN